MTAVAEALSAGAPSDQDRAGAVDWESIDWKAVRRRVYRLQVRIAKAVREKKYGKVKALQRLLTCSFSAKVLAVKRVMTNRGGRTPGVDGVVWKTPKDAEEAVQSLKRRGYRSLPRRRIYLVKPNGKLRPLGIPSCGDRAMEALYKLALDPVAETLAAPNSYGFREKRSTADAIEQCFGALARSHSAQWIWDADIRACFDRLSHPWLLRHIPMDRQVLTKWLKAGFIEADVFHRTEEGTPQGGIASPVIANMALDDLEATVHRVARSPGSKVNVVRYADDFIVTAASKEILTERVIPAVQSFLARRGLELSEEKTRIVHIEEGFNFLGFRVRKYRGRLLTKPAPEKVRAFVRKLKRLIRAHLGLPAADLIQKMNSRLRGWGNYYRHAVSKKTFARVDWEASQALYRWACRRHPNKRPKWVRDNYFRRLRSGRQVISALHEGRDGKCRQVDLFQLSSIPIRRHVKIRALANPYAPDWEQYFRQRHAIRRQRKLQDRRHYGIWGSGTARS